jgi:chromosome partitioning protein
MSEEELPLRAAAERFGVSLGRLRRAAWDGRLAARYLGHQYLVKPAEVERFLRDKGHQATPRPHGARPEGDGMAQIVAVAVPKGGTGKTTTTLNLGAALAEHGKRVLLVDFDPQASLTVALGLRPDELEHTVYSAIKYFLSTFESQVELAIRPTAAGVDLLPSNTLLNLANEELILAAQREFVLQNVLEPVTGRYDVILIDTLPYLGVLVVNALVAADDVLIPLEAEYLATASVSLIIKQVELMRRSRLNSDLDIAGILITKVDDRTIMSRETVAHARKAFGSRVTVFEQTINNSVDFPTSQARHETILQYAPQSRGAQAYRALAEEVLRAVAS